MKVLVVGRGWTGKKVFAELYNRNIIVDLASHNEALTLLNFNDYNWVINCTGVTGVPNVDACEDDPTNTMNGNVVYPILLHRTATQNGARFMHWSSGCIYQGNIDTVEADPNFFGSIYSISKGISDQYLKDKAVVIRIRMPFSSTLDSKNLITKLINYQQKAKLYNAGQNSMTDHDEAVRVSVDMLTENVDNGPYNLVNSGSMDMQQIAGIMGLKNVGWYTTEEFKAITRCERSTCVIPSDSRMRPLNEAFKEALIQCCL